jgi:hypothetical protein
MRYIHGLYFILVVISFILLYYGLGMDYRDILKETSINEGDLRNFALNLSSEILGVLIAVFLIEKAIREETDARRRKLLQTVFHRLTIKSELSLMMSLARPAAPEGSIISYSNLLEENYFEYVKKLDFSAEGLGIWSNSGKKMSWAEYIGYVSGEFNDSISRIIANYGMHLETEELEAPRCFVWADSPFNACP